MAHTLWRHVTITHHILSIYCGRVLPVSLHSCFIYCAGPTVGPYHILCIVSGKVTSLLKHSWWMRLIPVYSYPWYMYSERLLSLTQHSGWKCFTIYSSVTKHSWNMCCWMFMPLVQHLWCRHWGVLIYSQNLGQLINLGHEFLEMEWTWTSRIHLLVICRTTQPQNFQTKMHPLFKTWREKYWVETKGISIMNYPNFWPIK